MNMTIHPSQVKGLIVAPPSKSYTHRAIVIASLAQGKSIIKNPLNSDDTRSTIEACRKLGVEIEVKKDRLIIHGVDGHFPKKPGKIDIFCGTSGTTMRLITALSSLSSSDVCIDGEKRLRERPIVDLVEALRTFGIEIIMPNNSKYLPIYIKGGKINGGKITISGQQSSQFLSALLLIAPFAAADTRIAVSNLQSKPYVDITMDLMKLFGVNVEVNGNRYSVKSGQNYKAKKYTVEGDYSSASYFFAAGAITKSSISVGNLNSKSAQGDRYFLEILSQMKQNEDILHGIELDMKNYPDLVPITAVVASYARGETIIKNIQTLRLKESDRIAAITNGLSTMGIKVTANNFQLKIIGGMPNGAKIETYNDHRIAMSFAIAALSAKGQTVIKNAEAVNKSYPDFWKDLEKLGAKISYIN